MMQSILQWRWARLAIVLSGLAACTGGTPAAEKPDAGGSRPDDGSIIEADVVDAAGDASRMESEEDRCARYPLLCQEPVPNDGDGDGVPESEDCDDNNARVSPHLREIPCDGLDNNCDGRVECYHDRDQDGAHSGIDCDDNNPDVSPYEAEIPCNSVDENCDGVADCLVDRDGDGYKVDLADESDADDCNDMDPTIHPGAEDIPCDGIDQDCNGVDCCDQDADQDGFRCREECDDENQAIHPGANHDCDQHQGQVYDFDCSGTIEEDENCLIRP